MSEISGPGSSTRNAACAHDCSLPQALAIGRLMGLPLPADAEIHLVAIVAADVTTFDENLSASVAAAVPEACRAVRALAGDFAHRRGDESRA